MAAIMGTQAAKKGRAAVAPMAMALPDRSM